MFCVRLLIACAWLAALVVMAQTASANDGDARAAQLVTEGQKLNQALDLARANGNRADEGTALVGLAVLHDNPEDREKTIDELAQARKVFEGLGDKEKELQVVNMQGRALEMAKDFPAAIEAYERALALFREAANRKGEATMLLRLAQINERLPQPEASEKAATLFEQAVPLLQADSDRLNETVAWWGLGMMNDKMGRWDQGRDAYLKALPLLADLKDFPAGGQIVLSLAIDEEKLRQTEQAIGHYEQALRLLALTHDELDQYLAGMHLGKLRETLGQHAPAIEAYQAAAATAQVAGAKSNEGTARLRIGTLEFNLHAWKDALAAYGEAEKLFEAAGDRLSESFALGGMGAAYASLGEYKRKLDCSLQELALVQDGNDSRGKAAALLAVGDSYNALHESKRALDYLGQALTLNEQVPTAKAATLAEMGEVYYGMGDQTKALQLENEALAIFHSQGNLAAEAKVLDDIGLAHSAMGEKTKALEAFQNVLESARTRKDIQQQSATLNNLARLYQDFGDNQESGKLYAESLALVRQSGDRSQEAGTLAAFGMLCHSFGEEEKAIEKLNESLAERRSIEDRHGEAVTLNDLAIVYSDTGELQKALDSQNSALSIFRDLNDTSEIAGGLSTLGSIYQSLGLYDRAEGYFQQAREKQQESGDENSEAATLNNLGVVFQNLDQPQKALVYFEQSMALAEKLGNRAAQARLLASMAIALNATGHPSEVIEKLNRSLELARATGDVDAGALALHNLGSVYDQLGDLDKALEHYRQALGLWRQTRNESSAAKALSVIAKAERAQGKLELALGHINEAVLLNESLRNKLASQEQRASYLATAVNPYEIKIGILIQLHHEQPGGGYDAEAFATCEQARARSLLELLAESRADIRQGVDLELLEQERSIECSFNAKASRRQKLDTSSEDRSKLEGEIENLNAEHERIEALIRNKSPAYAALTQPRPLTLADVQNLVLDPDTLLLEYSLGEDRSYLWAVTQTSISTYELPKRSKVEKAVEDYFEMVSHSSVLDSEARAELDASAASLSEMLLGCVTAELNGKRLVIVSDAKLAAEVPFAALPVPSSSRPLILDHEVVSEPSASVMAILRHETTGRKLPSKVVAVFADPVFESNDDRFQETSGTTEPSLDHQVLNAARDGGPRLPRLIHARDEAEGILALTAPEGSLARLDFNASKKAAKDPELGNYRVVHFATHGMFDSTRPELSGLVLSLYDEDRRPVDGFLRLNEIFNLRLPVQVVVLSACESGQGKQVKGEGLVGLTRGFMYAGAASLVVSLWEVDDAATTELMIRFYRGLLGIDHLRPAAALRAAESSMMKEGKWGHPYYWAPFIIEGEWR